MFFDKIKKALGLDPNDKALKKYSALVDEINNINLENKSDDELKAMGADLKERAENIEDLDDILPETFALVREVSKRTIGLRHYDEQLIGGMALHDGRIAEMKTGEGKTLVATLAVVLNALRGEGVHLVTVNDYLAKRDAVWMTPIYNFLGLTVGVIYPYMPIEERYKAYRADITYGTNSEFGFDYLRDNMVMHRDQMVQRAHAYCIVDEVDSILIDEARTPLIISGPSDDNIDLYKKADSTARQLKEGNDFTKDEKERSISITETGIQKCEDILKMPGLFSDAAHSELAHRIVQALKAHKLFQRDTDYVVKDGEIIIVDEFTGRLMIGRRYSDGLHQAIEAKEHVQIGRESQTLATITLQNYFRMYRKLAGMTGTAATEAEEFKEIYGLQVVTIPTHKNMIRIDNPDVIYGTMNEKFNAVADDVEECHGKGQPVLVGTTSIENSERVSRLLKARKIPHQVLNAKYHEKEANIVAQAGREGAVTVATNMAGRGTDIMLGGNPEFLAREKLLKSLNNNNVNNDSEDEAVFIHENQEIYDKYLAEFSQTCREEHDKVAELGGLAIIGTERHESRRIDNQLRGRAGRQGDPGMSRFYLSLEDNLLRLFGSERIQGLMGKLGMRDGEAIESSMMSKVIESSQRKVEEMHFDIRKQLLAYDNVMNQQREAIYKERQLILTAPNFNADLKADLKADSELELEVEDIEGIENIEGGDDIISYGRDVVKGYVNDVLNKYFNFAEESDDSENSNNAERAASKIKSLTSGIETKFNTELEAEIKEIDSPEMLEEMREKIIDYVLAQYDKKMADLEPEIAGGMVRYVVLNILDNAWRDHLLAMDELRRGIGLRAIGQKDPLIEYQFESYRLFQDMMLRIRSTFAEQIFRVRVLSESDVEAQSRRERRKFSENRDFNIPSGAQNAAYNYNNSGEGRKPVHKAAKIGRNDPCPCGSGKKYKHCCGKGL